jgi:heparan-alpha-glucosaminide N-acetyltransferase
VVKRIWTPAWTLFSGGWCFLLLAAFCWVIEVKRYRDVGVPADRDRPELDCGVHDRAPVRRLHRLVVPTHLGPNAFAWFGAGWQPLVQGLAVLAVYWLMLYWMYQRKLFLRI